MLPCMGVKGWFHPSLLNTMLTVYLTAMLRRPRQAGSETQVAVGWLRES